MPEVRQHTIRLPSDMYDVIAMRALANRRSVNKEIEVMLQDMIARQITVEKAILDSMPSN